MAQSFFFLDEPVQVTMSYATWTTLDAHTYIPNLPAGATGVIICASVYSAGNAFSWRKQGSPFNTAIGSAQGRTMASTICGLDTLGQFQLFASTNSTICYIMGYTTAGVVMDTNPTTTNPSTLNTWSTITTAPAGTQATIFLTASTATTATATIRPAGTTWSAVYGRGGTAIVRPGTGNNIEGNRSSTSFNIYRVGYINDGVEMLATPINVNTPAVVGNFVPVHTLPSNAIGAIFSISTLNRSLVLRPQGSTWAPPNLYSGGNNYYIAYGGGLGGVIEGAVTSSETISPPTLAVVGYILGDPDPIEATPARAHLSLTMGKPTATVTNNVIARPARAHLGLTPNSPTASLTDHKQASPARAHLTITTRKPLATVTNNIVASPQRAHLTLTEGKPIAAVTANIFASPARAHLDITPGTPEAAVTNHIVAAPAKARLSLTAHTPTAAVTNNVSASPRKAHLVITPRKPSARISDASEVSPPPARLRLTMHKPMCTVTNNIVATPARAHLTLTPYTPTATIEEGIIAMPSRAHLTLTMHAPSAYVSDNITASPLRAHLTITSHIPLAEVSERGEDIVAMPPRAHLRLTMRKPRATISSAGSDIYTDLITFVDTTLRADTELATAMGGDVRIQPVWHQPDTPFPFIVQTLSMSSSEPWPMQDATLWLHLWSKTPSASQVIKMRERVSVLLEARRFTLPSSTTCRCRLISDGLLPDPEPGIWHMAMQFSVRLYKSTEADLILSRPN